MAKAQGNEVAGYRNANNTPSVLILLAVNESHVEPRNDDSSGCSSESEAVVNSDEESVNFEKVYSPNDGAPAPPAPTSALLPPLPMADDESSPHEPARKRAATQQPSAPSPEPAAPKVPTAPTQEEALAALPLPLVHPRLPFKMTPNPLPAASVATMEVQGAEGATASPKTPLERTRMATKNKKGSSASGGGGGGQRDGCESGGSGGGGGRTSSA